MSAEVVASTSDAEKKRQEAINKAIYMERDFVRDMEYLRDVRSKSEHILSLFADNHRLYSCG